MNKNLSFVSGLMQDYNKDYLIKLNKEIDYAKMIFGPLFAKNTTWSNYADIMINVQPMPPMKAMISYIECKFVINDDCKIIADDETK